MMHITKEEVQQSIKKSDRLKRALRVSKDSYLSKENYPDFPEPGVGFPPYPIIELPIDSIEASDYENADKAMYSVDDLRGILIDEIRHHRLKREKHAAVKKSGPTSLNGSMAYKGSKSP